MAINYEQLMASKSSGQEFTYTDRSASASGAIR
jgi:hypothetical protein